MSNYKGILTNKGKELLANAAMGNRVNFSHLALGDGNGSTPTLNETRTALVKERHRLTLNSVDINPNNRNQIICEVIIPTNIGGFTVRELGLFAGNFLVMHSTYPPTYKPRQDEGGAREMVIRVVINVQNADVVALYLDTSLVYATRGWVETNFINHNEVIDNLTSTDTNKPLSAAQGKKLNTEKLAKAGDTMTGALQMPTSATSPATSTPFAISYGRVQSYSNIYINANTDNNSSDEPVIITSGKGISSNKADGLAVGSNYLQWLGVSVATVNSNVASATKLHTVRTINGVAFDGTANITISDNTKANKTTQFTAGAGLTGGGDLSASRSLSLGTPSKITANSTNTAVSNTHSHEIDKASTTTAGIVQLNDTLTSTATNQALTANQGKVLNDTKVNRSGDTMTGLLRVSYANDWVGFAANNPTEGKNIYFDAQVNNVARGGLQLVSRGNGRYDAIIGITPTGATTSDRRVGGLTISQDGLHAHAYGALHEYFVKTRDDQTINGLKSFSSSITVGSHNNWGRVTFPLPDNTNWVIETNPQYKSLGVGQPAFRFNHNDGGNRIFYDLLKSNKSENIAYQSWTSDHFVAHDEVVNNLTSADINKPLSALQGKKLNDDKLDKAGGVLTGGLYLHPNGLRSSGDTDTGIDFPRDGVMRMIADGRERLIIEHGGTSLKTQEGIKLSLQNDKNLVVYDEQNRPIFSSHAVLNQLNNKLDKTTGGTVAGHIRLNYQNDWVGYSANNPTEGKNGYYDVEVNGIARGGLQIVSRGNGRYDAIIGITPTGATTSDRRVGGLTISQNGLHAHAYGALHEYFVKTRDDQTITGIKTFSSSPKAPTPPANSNDTTVATTAFVRTAITSNTAVLTGTIAHGGTLPLPAGFSEAQCKFMVSVNKDNPNRSGWDINESGSHFHYGFECWLDGRTVHVGALRGHYGHATFTPGMANYMVVGIK